MNKIGSAVRHLPAREEMVRKIEEGSFDVVIIGGGITGAGIALDAVTRGLRVLLLEKGDFASGTSSRSTKLIHGGLRYLKQLQLHIVAETGRERAILHRLAPHLVVPRKMVLPVLRESSMGKGMVALGLRLYDLLAGVKGNDRMRMLSRAETLGKVPLLPAGRVTGAGFYAEYLTDDARLTLEVIKTAIRHGAICLNYAEVTRLIYDRQGKVKGVVGKDRLTEQEIMAESDMVVNATGPWVDEFRRMDGSLHGKHLFLTKGIHLVFSKEVLPLDHPVYFDIPDGRMIFLIPRHGIVYAGTTDTPYEGPKESPPVYREDVEYVLAAIRYLFPSLELTERDVLSSWAGIRPLIYEKGKDASEISRRDEIFISPSGLISMAGGKLTGYRKMAEKVVDLLVRKLGKGSKKCLTRQIPLTLSPFRGLQEVEGFVRQLRERFSGIEEEDLAEMVMKHGKTAGTILEHAEKEGISLLLAEAFHALESEMACRPLDFLERRSGSLLFRIERVRAELDPLLEIFARQFHWEPERMQKEKQQVAEHIKAITPPFSRAADKVS